MKRILAMLIVLILAMASTVMALAATDPNDPTTWQSDEITFQTGGFKKTVTTSGVSNNIVPTETLQFTSSPDTSNPDTTNLTVTGFAVTQAEGYLEVKVPKYSKVGVYKYTIAETAGNTQGETYSTSTVGLTVVVTYDYNEKKLVATPGITKNASGQKENEFINTYVLGALTVTKTVEGNMGNTNQPFDITITLNSAEGKYVNSDITVSGGTDTGNVQTVEKGWTGTKKVNIKIKSGETVTINNVPKGVSYIVEESEAHAAADLNGSNSATGYTIEYDGNETGTIAIDDNSIQKATTVKNTKNVTVDTGIELETLPYLMIIAIALFSTALLVVRRRNEQY